MGEWGVCLLRRGVPVHAEANRCMRAKGNGEHACRGEWGACMLMRVEYGDRTEIARRSH